MKTRVFFFLVAVVLVCAIVLPTCAVGNSGFGNKPTEVESELVVSRLSSMPLSFTKNEGQFGKRAKFRCNTLGAVFYYAAGEVAHLFSRGTDEVTEESMGPWTNVLDIPDPPNKYRRPRYNKERLVVRAKFVGADSDAEVTGEDVLPHKCNYFYGNDPSKWHTNVPSYSAVRYWNIYPGIDLRYYGDGYSLKYDFIVKPGADPSRIQIEYDGVSSLSVNTQGELVVSSRFGEVIEKVPYVYQEIGDDRQEIPCHYAILERNRFGFALERDYDQTRPLFIDPEVVYSTYLGGSGSDKGYEWGHGIAVDGYGYVYVTGWTNSNDFPTTPGTYDTSYNIWDVFVTKFSPSGDSLIYSTYLGGGLGDDAYGIALDADGCIYVTGRTNSIDFPTVNPYDDSLDGEGDVFVAKLSASGDSLIYSTYMGGSLLDGARGIAVDGQGCAYVTGETESPDFPTLNPYDGSWNGDYDAFVAKLCPSGDSLLYSTYLGGSAIDGWQWGAIAVDSERCAYVTGMTESSDFPTVNPYDGSWNGHYDAFVTKLSPSGDSLIYSTYLGGGWAYWEVEYGLAIAVDSKGCVYVTGETWSPDFPRVNNPYNYNGVGDAFLTKFSASGQSIVYSTHLGGSDWDLGHAIAVDNFCNAYVTGLTMSTDFPTVNPYQSEFAGGWERFDAFVAKFCKNVPPCDISSLTVASSADTSVTLYWTAPGDDDTVGSATIYDIRYSTKVPDLGNTSAWWGAADTVTNEPTPSLAGHKDSCVVTGLSAGQRYYFAIKAADEFPNWSGISNIVSAVVVAVEEQDASDLPKSFSLAQNYPNPFNPITEVKYALPKDSRVKLIVYNLLGQRVITLVDEKQVVGYKTARWDASSFSSGIYFYRLEAGDFVQTRKMVLIK